MKSKSLFKGLFVAAMLGLVLLSVPASAKADHDPYWRNHWGWYHNTYGPYYHNYYNSPAYYGTYSGPGLGGAYYPVPVYNYGYGYYGGPYVAPGVGVHVGRANFGWW